MKSVVLLSVLCFILNKSFTFVLKRREPYRLDIIHYNDFHDRFEETSVDYPLCSTNDTRCLGGFARLYHEVTELKRTRPDALVLDAGDTFQGTYWYTLLKWNVTQHFINMLPNDAHALGNHEFDDHVSGLVPYLSALHAPVLAANMDARKEPRLHALTSPTTLVTRQGRRVGIIGLITTETSFSSNPDGVVFLDPVNTTKFYAEKLNREGIDIIILLSHCGLIVDKQIAKEAGEYVDVIVGGHSHSLLWSGEPPSHELAQGPYPVVVEPDSAPGHKVVIVQASAYTKYLGNLTLFFDDDGEVQRFEGTPVFLNRSIPEDPSIKALMQPYSDKLHAIVGEVVGYSQHDLPASACESGECKIGNLITDSYVDAAKATNISDLPHVAFVTRNNLRGSMSKGDITRGDLITTMPFSNHIVTCVLKGKYLVQAFEQSFKSIWRENPFAGPLLTQVSGVQLTLNAKEGKAVKVLVREGEKFVPLDPERDYQLSVTDFVANGGQFSMIKEHGRDIRAIGLDREVLENYVKKVTPNFPKLENRLTIIN